MSVIENLKSTIRRLSDQVVGWFSPEDPALNLPTEFTRYFLSDAIELRLKSLQATGIVASPAEGEAIATNAASSSVEVIKEYTEKLNVELKRDLANPQIGNDIRRILEKHFASTTLRGQLNDSNTQSRESIHGLLRTPRQFNARWEKHFEIQLFMGFLLRGLQQVALNILRLEYVSPAKIDNDVQSALRRVLFRIDQVSKVFASPLQIKNAQIAETEVRVAVARNSGAATLPLRPIASAPLSNADFAKLSAAQPSEAVLRLSRQIRHDDGSILVTGYRGVGKSSFVNRAIYEALGPQDSFPEDERLLVPVTVNLAKISGVQNILRLTLRAVRESLLEDDGYTPKRIPCRDQRSSNPIPLPLRVEEEVKLLHEAYLRATHKVTMANATVSERSHQFGSEMSFDPGAILRAIPGVSLGKFLSASINRKRVEKITRELNLLDYDENAAEDDLGKLIRRLAEPRSLSSKDDRRVQIKLVFVFDELDKMDVESGLMPMIEGLKNLFLQHNAVFILVTSKKFYYDLLQDRVVEDAMMNSYFTSIVNVPLLQYAGAREIVRSWVFWESTEQLKLPSPDEQKLLDQLTRVLVYRSCGNPRDMIRELRAMQEWSENRQPYLSDQGSNSISLQVFAALQDCVEKTAGHSSPGSTGQHTGVPLVSDRVTGDESRLEQIRRGLYILIEELINRKKITISPPETRPNRGVVDGVTTVTPATPPPAIASLTQSPLTEQLRKAITAKTKPLLSPSPSVVTNGHDRFTEAVQVIAGYLKPKPTANLSVFEKIHQDNFSLFSLEEIQELAKKLGDALRILHLNQDLFYAPEWGERRPLFELTTEEISVTDYFYELTGRQALSTPTGAVRRKLEGKEAIIKDALYYVGRESWSDKLMALGFIKELTPGDVRLPLQAFLIEAAQNAPEANDRFRAAELINHKFLFNAQLDLSDLLTKLDERVLLVLLTRLAEAPDDTDKARATTAILALLKQDTTRTIGRKTTDDVAVKAFTVLATVAETDVINDVLNWLTKVSASDLARSTALNALTVIVSKVNVKADQKTDLVDRIIGNQDWLTSFVTGAATPWERLISTSSKQESELKKFFRDQLLAQPLENAAKLLESELDVESSVELLSDLYTIALNVRHEDLVGHIFSELQKQRRPESLAKVKLRTTLSRMLDYQAVLLPQIQKRLLSQFEGDPGKRDDLSHEIELVTELAEKKRSRSIADEKIFVDRFTWQEMYSKSKFPSVPLPPPGVAPTMIPEPPLRVERRLTVNTAVYVLLAIAAFIPGFIFFKGDLPAAATFFTLVKSRLLLFLIDFSIVAAFFASYLRISKEVESANQYLGIRRAGTADSLWEQTLKNNPAISFIAVFAIVYALRYVHERFIGPLTFPTQAIQFLINLPSIGLLLYAYTKALTSPRYKY